MSGTNLSDPIVVREASGTSEPRVKPQPSAKFIPVPFEYSPSDDGTDDNLLVLFHGLGDTHMPFARLGKQLKLPQTATLALRAPDKIPYLYEEAYQWYESFDLLGEMIERPNPTSAMELLSGVFRHLTEDLKWPVDHIHIFGFAQGGSVATEFALKWWRSELDKQRKAQVKPVEENETQESTSYPKTFKSIVTIGGPLMSYPTVKTPCSTPVIVLHRPAPSQTSLSAASLTALNKGFSNVSAVTLPAGEGMPRSQEEWMPIMRFWSEKLSRRPVDGLYEVMSGTDPLR